MRNFEELNINDAGRPVSTPSPSGLLIERFQQRFNVLLPSAYIKLLAFANGGHPELSACNCDDQNYPISIDHFFSLTEDEELWNGLWRRTILLRSVLNTEHLVAIATDGTGDVIFLYLAGGKEEVKIYFRPDDIILKVANSFEQFIDRLYSDPDLE